MINTAIGTFFLTDEQLENSPSRKDGIDVKTETTLRIYGCDLIQESGISLRLYPDLKQSWPLLKPSSIGSTAKSPLPGLVSRTCLCSLEDQYAEYISRGWLPAVFGLLRS